MRRFCLSCWNEQFHISAVSNETYEKVYKADVIYMYACNCRASCGITVTSTGVTGTNSKIMTGFNITSHQIINQNTPELFIISIDFILNILDKAFPKGYSYQPSRPVYYSHRKLWYISTYELIHKPFVSRAADQKGGQICGVNLMLTESANSRLSNLFTVSSALKQRIYMYYVSSNYLF